MKNMQDILEIHVDDIRRAEKKLQNGKAPGVDGITSEMLQYGSESMTEWLMWVVWAMEEFQKIFREG